MRIKLKEDASGIYARGINDWQYSSDWWKTLKKVAGQWIEVETDYLFRDQFNTVPIPGVSDLGLRIMEKWVEEVEDDERIGKWKCRYCGWVADIEVDDLCRHCGETKYMEPLCKESEISLDYMRRAKAEREAGGSVEVHPGGLYVAITMSDGSEYFFQGEEADNLEAEYKEVEEWLTCSFEDYLLAIAQSW